MPAMCFRQSRRPGHPPAAPCLQEAPGQIVVPSMSGVRRSNAYRKRTSSRDGSAGGALGRSGGRGEASGTKRRHVTARHGEGLDVIGR